MKNIDRYIVKYPSSIHSGTYIFYHAYKTRTAARKACRHLIDDLGLNEALLVSIKEDSSMWCNCSVIKEEVFL